MRLTYEQKMEIYRNGFVKVPGVVPQVMVDRAVKAINHSLGQNGIPPDDLPTFRSQSYCPEVQKDAAITDLINKTPAWQLAESAIGDGKIVGPAGAGQIALRFPGAYDPPPLPQGHLDGLYSPNNGVPKGEIHNFTMLLGIVLSDVPEPYSGNLAVWPGSHHLYEQYCREEGPESLLSGMPPDEIPKPYQMTGKAGDVVLCHYQVCHGAAPNTSPNTRYAIYFRLRHADLADHRFESMKDIWMDWEGMREIVEEQRQAVA